MQRLHDHLHAVRLETARYKILVADQNEQMRMGALMTRYHQPVSGRLGFLVKRAVLAA